MPIAATASYAAAGALGLERVPVASIVYFWITGPAGFLLALVAMIQCARRHEGGVVLPTRSVLPSDREGL